MNAPIAIFAYNRPDHLQAMLATLSQCQGFDTSPVVVFCDGAKGEVDREGVEKVREIVSGLGWANLELVFADRNKGLKRSISEGVTAVAARYGRVIVLEDDLHLSPVALDFFNAALDKYADCPRVWSISGYMYDVPQLRERESALFLPFAQSWGWATWHRAWSQFDPDEELPDDVIHSRSFKKAFAVNGISDFADMLQLARDGLVSSWFVRWHYKIFMDGGVSLFPPVTYVSNRGISGGGGTHAGRFNPYELLVKPRSPAKAMVRLPDQIRIDFSAMDVVPRSWEATVLRFIHTVGSYKRRLKRSVGM